VTAVSTVYDAGLVDNLPVGDGWRGRVQCSRSQFIFLPHTQMNCIQNNIPASLASI